MYFTSISVISFYFSIFWSILIRQPRKLKILQTNIRKMTQLLELSLDICPSLSYLYKIQGFQISFVTFLVQIICIKLKRHQTLYQLNTQSSDKPDRNNQYIQNQTISQQPFLNSFLSRKILTTPLAMITTVQMITRIVFVSIYLFSFYTQFKEPLVMDFRIYCCPIREFRTVVNFYSSFANQVDYVVLVQVLIQVLAALDLLIFFKVNSSQDRQIWRVLTQDLRIIFISPVPVQLTLNTPIFLSQKVFFSVSSCSNPTNSPLLFSEVMQNMPRKFFTSGDGQKINVCCSDGASSNENDYVGRKSARCQAKAQNCCYQCYYQQIVEVRPRKMNSKGVSLREKRVYI